MLIQGGLILFTMMLLKLNATYGSTIVNQVDLPLRCITPLMIILSFPLASPDFPEWGVSMLWVAALALLAGSIALSIKQVWCCKTPTAKTEPEEAVGAASTKEDTPVVADPLAVMLEEMELQEHLGVLNKHKITLADLPLLSASDLTGVLGIPLGHAARICQQCRTAQEQGIVVREFG